MPFTPFHLGPALVIGLPLKKYMHAPTFILANVILDVEPFLVLSFGLNYPLHGYLHTFILALLIGIAFGYVMVFLEKYLHPLYRGLLLEGNQTTSFNQFIIASILGTELHVLFDSPLYWDIQPFYPITMNPLYNPNLSLAIYSLCIWLGIIGITIYAAIAISAYIKGRNKIGKN